MFLYVLENNCVKSSTHMDCVKLKHNFTQSRLNLLFTYNKNKVACYPQL